MKSLHRHCQNVLTVLAFTWFFSCHARAADYTVLDSHPHYSGGFTQGLEIHNKMLYESSGLYGRSFITYGDLRGGHRQLALPDDYFAEGLTIINDKLYLLTWKQGVALVFNPYTLSYKKRFHYSGEGWGLTNNTRELIMSDGSNQLRFIDPDTFEELRTLSVFDDGLPIDKLNELEWHKGLIVANRWQSNTLYVIDETSGEVLKQIDLTGLYPPAMRRPGTDVMNGIAYDAHNDTWLVTGKHWPRLYRLKLTLPDTGDVSQPE